MRSSKSRSRNKNNRNRNSLGNVVNRVFDSSGPEGKVRGTPQQIIDKYNQLARDASLGNDRVATENFQQHAEHYLRMLSEAQREQDQRREQQERENRERQAQRDRDRGQQRDQNDGDQRSDDGDQPEASTSAPETKEKGERQPSRRRQKPAVDPSDAPQPDIFDVVGGDDDGPGLVETPESRAETRPAEETKDEAPKPAPKPRKPRAPRKPRQPKAEASDAPATETPQTPDAAAE